MMIQRLFAALRLTKAARKYLIVSQLRVLSSYFLSLVSRIFSLKLGGLRHAVNRVCVSWHAPAELPLVH